MTPDFTRYQRQMSLPEITPREQARLGGAHTVFLGAGGLGAPALPYLAGAGVGRITIIDDDAIDLLNLHRQTVYRDSEIGRGKAETMAAYLRALNPGIEIMTETGRLRPGEEAQAERIFAGADLIIDGSDNFTTKSLLNGISVRLGIPLISASVNQWTGQCGIFAGFAAGGPCYHCLFPELPAHARNCNEAGILGTAAGLAGMIQAHLSLLYLLGMESAGTVLTMDFKTMRITRLALEKNPDCPACAGGQAKTAPREKEETPMIEIVPMEELKSRPHLIVDVRTAAEIAADPIPGALHMELTSVPARHGELPGDTLLAFVCAGNVRSVQAAHYLCAMGYENVCVLDKFSL